MPNSQNSVRSRTSFDHAQPPPFRTHTQCLFSALFVSHVVVSIAKQKRDFVSCSLCRCRQNTRLNGLCFRLRDRVSTDQRLFVPPFSSCPFLGVRSTRTCKCKSDCNTPLPSFPFFSLSLVPTLDSFLHPGFDLLSRLQHRFHSLKSGDANCSRREAVKKRETARPPINKGVTCARSLLVGKRGQKKCLSLLSPRSFATWALSWLTSETKKLTAARGIAGSPAAAADLISLLPTSPLWAGETGDERTVVAP